MVTIPFFRKEVLPTEIAVPELTLRSSFLVIWSTLSNPSLPIAESNKLYSKSIESYISGSSLTFPITQPKRESLLVIAGSKLVPKAINPPGEASLTNPAEVAIVNILVLIDLYLDH